MNRRFIYLGFLLSIVLISKQSISQDIHFSNLSMTQLYTSIGSVGGSTSLFSASTEYRNQWPTIGNAYTTIGMTAAGRIETKNGAIGIGFIANSDQAGDLSLTRLQAEGAFAYHQKVSRRSFFSAGVQGGIIQHSIDETNAEWQTQFNGKEFDPTRSSGENPLFQPFINYTLGTGVQWEYNNILSNRFSKNISYTRFGLSVYHAFASKLDYNASEKEYARVAFSGNAIYAIDIEGSQLEPAFVYQQKGKEKELVLGVLYRYVINRGSRYTSYKKKLDFAAGAYYRIPNDALIPAFNMNYANYQLGITYDVNVSQLTQASRTIGGLEFSLRFIIPN